MAYSKAIVPAKLVGALYEAKTAIYNSTNRSFDSLMQQGYDFVDIPLMGKLNVLDDGVEYDDALRTEFKASTNLVRCEVAKKIIPMAESLEAKFNKAPFLDAYTSDATRALTRKFNKIVIGEAQTTTAKLELLAQNNFDVDDFMHMKEHFDNNEVPETDRYLAFPSSMQRKLWKMDVIKQAAAFNPQNLKTGVFVELFGFTIFVTSLIENVDGKKNMVAWYGPGLAFLIAPFMDRGEAYVSGKGRLIDLISFVAKKLYSSEYAVIKFLE